MDDESIFARGSGMVSGPQKKSAMKNCQTMIHVPGGVFAREPLAGPIALARYESDLRQVALANRRDRVFVVALDSAGSYSQHRVLAPGESMVFGRHEQAHIRYESKDFSLRHLAVAVAPSSTADAPLLRVWDLATGRPFKTEDGLLTEALTADGPVFATIGSIHIAVIPLGVLPEKLPLGTRALWQALPARDVISRVAVGSAVRPLPPPQSPSPGRVTMVTRIPSVSAPEDCAPELAVAELCLTTDASIRKYRISLESLERGILIGRYERCIKITGDMDPLSRVHLLISKIGSDVVAIDTASTFGSTRSMQRGFETAVLGQSDDIWLAKVLRVEWKYDRPVMA